MSLSFLECFASLFSFKLASPTTSPEASGVSSPGVGAWEVGDFLVKTLLPEPFVFADIVRYMLSLHVEWLLSTELDVDNVVAKYVLCIGP